MNKYRYILVGLFLLFSQVVTLSAAEGDPSLAINASHTDNKYLQENARLIKLAEDSYVQGKYDDAIKFAQEAMKFAQLSDDYVNATDAVAAAQIRIDWAKSVGAPKRHAEIYEKAAAAFDEAQTAYADEDWNKAKSAAERVIAILAEIPDTPVFAAQYRVKNWVPMKDCLWNIAAKPEIYDDPFQWRHIYNANKSKLPKSDNPDLVLPGTLLDIPSIKGEFRAGILEGD
jgi:tetratricopeptide (TPR) repeat protein